LPSYAEKNKIQILEKVMATFYRASGGKFLLKKNHKSFFSKGVSSFLFAKILFGGEQKKKCHLPQNQGPKKILFSFLKKINKHPFKKKSGEILITPPGGATRVFFISFY
jgi:hypothetical protein